MLLRRDPKPESVHSVARWVLLSITLTICGCGDDIVGPGAHDEPLVDCFDYSLGDPPPIVATVATNYPYYHSLVSGCARYDDVLYVASGGELAAVDVSNPESPRILATHSLPRRSGVNARCTVSAGGPPAANHETVCVLDWYSGFWFSIAGPDGACTTLSFTQTSTPSYDIVQIGNRVFVATLRNGVEVYDISAPAAPCAVATLEPGKAVFDLCVAGTNLYLALGYDGILVYQVLDGSTVLLEQTDHPAFLIVAEGNDVYAVCPQLPFGGPLLLTRFVADDISTSGSLVPASAAELSTFPRSLAVHDSVVYVAAGSMGLEVFLEDPDVGVRRLTSLEITMPVMNVSTVGDFLYVGSWQGLHILPLQCSESSPGVPAPILEPPEFER